MPTPRPRPKRRDGRRRGVALLIVTVSVALLTIMGTQFAFDSRVQFEMAVNARDEVRAYFLARSGVSLSRLLLSFQKQVNNLQLPPEVETLVGKLNIQLWKMARIDCHMLSGLVPDASGELQEPAEARALPEGNFDSEFPELAGQIRQRNFGTFTGCFLATLGDEEQKINVARLNSVGGNDAATVQALLSLMDDQRFEFLFETEDSNGVKVTPQDLIVALKDWIDDDAIGDALNLQALTTSPFQRGFADENREYSGYEPPYETKNAGFDSLGELYRVHGVNDRFMAAFGDRLTVYPDVNRNLNINSDDPMLLYAAILTALDPTSPQGRMSPQLQNPLFVQQLIQQIEAARMFTFMGMSVKDFVTILETNGLVVNPVLKGQNSTSRLLSDTSETFSIQSVGEAGNVTKTITTVVRSGAQDGPFGRLVYWREE